MITDITLRNVADDREGLESGDTFKKTVSAFEIRQAFGLSAEDLESKTQGQLEVLADAVLENQGYCVDESKLDEVWYDSN